MGKLDILRATAAVLNIVTVLAAGTASGSKLREPRILASHDGMLEMNLTVTAGTVEGPFGISFQARLFDGEFPGPTIRVEAGDFVDIDFRNELDYNDEGDLEIEPNTMHSPNTTNLHFHGLHISPTGAQDNMHIKVHPFERFNYGLEIHDLHDAGTNYYHPHHDGSSTVQVQGGMAGAFIVDDKPKATPNELLKMREHICILQSLYMDDLMDQNGIMDNNKSNRMPLKLKNPNNITGNIMLVNGQYVPEIDMGPMEILRLRMINGLIKDNVYFESNGCSVWEIAKDGVYLDGIRSVEKVLVASGSRSDILVQCNKTGDFTLTTVSDYVSESLKNTWGPGNADHETQNILNMRVRHSNMTLRSEPPVTALPPHLPKHDESYYLSKLREESAILPLVEDMNTTTTIAYSDSSGNKTINGHYFNHNVSEATVKLDTLYQWRAASLEPTSGDGTYELHPHHQHAHHFLMMNTDSATNGLLWTKGEIRDTIPMYNHSDAIFRLLPADYTGHTMVHCHALWHADNGMASLFEVTE